MVIVCPDDLNGFDDAEDWLANTDPQRVADAYEAAGMDRDYGEAVARVLRSEARGEDGPPVD